MDPREIISLPLDLLDAPETPIRTSMTDAGLDELAHSLAVEGLLQPILVYPLAERFVLRDGGRRARAARMLRWPTIDAIITAPPAGAAAAASLIANIQREDMNPMDEARALTQLLDYPTPTNRDLARRVGKDPTWVSQRLALLDLDPSTQAMVEARALPMSHALALAKIPVAGWRAYYTQHAIDEGVNLDTVRAWVAHSTKDILRQQAEGLPTNPPSEWQPPPEPLYPCWACTVPRPMSQLQTQHVCRDCLKTIAAAAAGGTE